MKVHLLDMGEERYGDAVLVTEAERIILVDGGHPGDWKSRGETRSIPEQLAAILGHPPPFDLSLLVVTHCHADHIGCLPRLVSEGTLTARWALVPDEALAFPPTPASDADPVVDAVLAGLREEPRPDLTGAELNEFLADAVTLRARYETMLADLTVAGTRLVRFRGGRSKDVLDLQREFQDLDLRVLGPTAEHLKICAGRLAAVSRATRSAIVTARQKGVDGAADAAWLYRRFIRSHLPLDLGVDTDLQGVLDGAGKGAALNNQSVILRIGLGKDTALLTGDMQLAAAETPGLDGHMEGLVKAIARAGPYGFVKLPHHGSYNGFDDTVLQALHGTTAFGISTGRAGADHPNPDVLDLLAANDGLLSWARTDVNGLVEVTLQGGEVDLSLARGDLDDATVGTSDGSGTAGAPTAEPDEPSTGTASEAPAPPRAAGQPQAIYGHSHESPLVPVTPRLPTPPTPPALGGIDSPVEIYVKVPHVSTRVTLTIDVQPADAASSQPRPSSDERQSAPPPRPSRLAGGRSLPPLLFVTDSARLSAAVGAEHAAHSLTMVRNAGVDLIDLSAVPASPDAIRSAATAVRGLRGVVILGGYGVVPAERYDVLPPDLRLRLGRQANDDPDNFVVWSDQAYGDLNGDGLGDVAVSRIPDGGCGVLLNAALTTTPHRDARARFGIRNSARPFADAVFRTAMGADFDMHRSEPAAFAGLPIAEANAERVYLMLHGSETDASSFSGENRGQLVEAFSAASIPEAFGGVVFAGCCWGALTTTLLACEAGTKWDAPSRSPAGSIALAFLKRGARAFVGCTGAHYSPIGARPDAFGAPLHVSFWKRSLAGAPPAEALFDAKVDYVADMPHGGRTYEEQAVEFKTLRQFTCLGLGW
ncbi:MBL fold metallo-hydrolase [Methylobacterium sp. WL69]|uniref:ComEC/Rec2 family competence protein n=1 Tax=Methylobacterium sp. WL69 TaxID=2603893 RepID=UPI0011C87F29|nr:MBL fold metallo-hydrolase [Methylobacterium sp. WL69]TXM74200.1 MBL fold metallo-hydrolase [Methylobacterium sp. WL69]